MFAATFLYKSSALKKKTAIYVLFAVIICGLQSLSSYQGLRHQFPLINVLLQRVLIDKQYTDWFIEHGMPVDSDILSWKREWASSEGLKLYADPQYERFMDWTRTKGSRTYALFLLTHPAYTFFSPFLAKEEIISFGLIFYTYENYKQKAPVNVLIDIFFMVVFLLINQYSAIILALYVFFKNKKRNILYCVPFFIVAAFLFNALLVYHADAMEVERHSLMNLIAFQVSGLMGVLLLLKKKPGQLSPDASCRFSHTVDIWDSRRFTAEAFTRRSLSSSGIGISMNCKGRRRDTGIIEQFRESI